MNPEVYDRQFFYQLFEQAREALVVTDEQGIIVLLNQQMEQLLGIGREDLHGLDMEELIPGFRRHCLSGKNRGTVENPVSTSLQEDTLLQMVCSKGHKFPVSISLLPFNTPEGPRFVAQICDISVRVRMQQALQSSEEKYRVLVESASEGIIIANEKGDMMLTNQRAEELFGYQPGEMRGKPVELLIPQTQRAGHSRYREGFIKKPRRRTMGQGINLTGLRKDGTSFPIEVSLSPVKVAGEMLVMAFVVDISAKLEAERIAELQRQQLIQADKMATLGILVSGVAHEINNPNNFIMLNAGILKDVWNDILPVLRHHYEENRDFKLAGMPYDRAGDKISRLIAGTAEGAVRIQRIVENLKNFARQDPGELDQEVDCNAVVESAITITNNLIRRSTNAFSIELTPGLPPVKGNFQRLEQVVINLLTNACDAITDRSCPLKVSSLWHQESGEVEVVVEDGGAGIPDDALNHVFDPFFTTKRTAGGTGLGLSICYNIVTSHKGILKIVSEAEKGTRVSMHLPARESQP